jgi:hypothetical protein
MLTDDTPHRSRFETRLFLRLPESLHQAINTGADRELTTASEYVRRALVEKLRADGVLPAARAA